MALDYTLLDVFTDRPFGGNQLAVFTEADGLADETMQSIARELNLSETVFVMPPQSGGDFRLRIFTPRVELPFAGHPTIGAALVLAGSAGRSELLLEEAAGPVRVQLGTQDGRPFASLTAPAIPQAVPVAITRSAAAAILGLGVEALAAQVSAAYSAGVPFLFIPLASAEALEAVELDVTAWREQLADSPAPHVVAVFARDLATAAHIDVRMFAPAMGIAEDPATGAAAAALAGLLLDLQRPEGTARWTIGQGAAMGRPSTIFLEAEVEEGRATAVRVGGTAVVVGHGTLEI